MSDECVWGGYLEFVRRADTVIEDCHGEESTGIEVLRRFGSVVEFLEMRLEVWILPEALQRVSYSKLTKVNARDIPV